MSQAKRGEIWMADPGMIAKVRPVLILSVEYQENERAVVTYVVRTTSTRRTQYEVAHKQRGMKDGAFDAHGIASIPDVKLERRIGSVDKETLDQVGDAVCHWLSLYRHN